MPATGPDRPAEPRAPRLPDASSPCPDPELDQDYPDIDSVEIEDQTIALPEARTVSVLRSRLTDCEVVVDDDVPVEVHDSVLTGST